MPHVAFVPLTGLRVQAEEILELGMTLPGLRRRADAIAELPALGLLTLAGLTPASWTCSYHPAGNDDEQLVEQVLATRPALVALSALTASINQAYQLSARLRSYHIPVVLGGLHATALADEAAKYCDAVVVGEGEPVWHEILADAQSGRLKQIYRAAAPFDMSRSPMPRFDLLAGRAHPRWTLQTERGCPFACEFCGASRLLGPFREKPIPQIRAELSELGRLARRPWLELADDNTFASGRRTDELLTVLADANVRYFTEADWRVGEQRHLLDPLAASGCVQLLLGIESLVFRYPGMGAKQAELERVMNSVRAIQEAGVVVNGCFIVGADGETNESLDRMIAFILDSPFAEIQITIQTPFPSTALHQRLKQTNRLLADRGWSYYTLFDVTYRPDRMTAEDLQTGFQRVVRSVFEKSASQKRSALRKAIWQRNPRFVNDVECESRH